MPVTSGGGRRAVLLLVVLVLVVSSVLFVAWRQDWLVLGAPAEDSVDRVLIVAAAPDDRGDVVAGIIAIIDLTDPDAEPVALDPLLPVTIPGTSYESLADAYPFGGGEGVAEALARAHNEAVLPYVSIGPKAFEEMLLSNGQVQVNVPADMSIFDGQSLFTFAQGAQSLSAEEVIAVLKGAPYLTDSEREALNSELAGMLAGVLGRADGGLRGAAEASRISTNLSEEALDRVQRALE